MADVFLSYKREDAAKVRKLVAALRQKGLDTWWDEDIPPSAPWESTIEKELAGAKAVIVCWSPDAVASDNVRSEARVARQDGLLIQIFLKPCSPPLFFGERQGVDLSSWRGKADDARIGRIAESARKVAAGERIDPTPQRKGRKRVDLRVVAAVAALLLMMVGGAAWWKLRATPEGPQTLAILPFRALNANDGALVDAIWDDTRGAITHNPNIRVLGRQTVEALAKQSLEPADYRRKVGADFLLDGNVQRAGDKVLMNVSLTRTKDGTEVWSDSVGGKLNDVFAFQQQIAREVEGRIRGRVAPGGGVKAQNIATTGEVYSIYADARADMRKRDPEGFHAAIALLKKAVAIDPNYAPAWASLGQAMGMGLSATQDTRSLDRQNEAVSYLKHALELAPNLAHAHAALAMVQNFAPQLDGELRKAVELDPSDAEAWGWLANSLQNQNRLSEALRARERVVSIEPLWYWASVNKIGTLGLMRDWKGIDAEIERVSALGDPVMLAKSKWGAAGMTNRPGDAVRILLQLRAAHANEASWVDTRIFGPLMQLGFLDEAMRAWHLPPNFAEDYRGKPPPHDVIQHDLPSPLDIWIDGNDAMALYGRMMPKQGRLKEYVGYYDAAFKSPDELFAVLDQRPGILLGTAPTLAVNLRADGRNDDADTILRHADQLIQANTKNGAPTTIDLARLAYLRGAEGREDEAVELLQLAVEQGWLPDRMFTAIDIADEPCFAGLLNRPDFGAVRQKILDRMEQERRKVPLDLLAKAYPPAPTKAAA